MCEKHLSLVVNKFFNNIVLIMKTKKINLQFQTMNDVNNCKCRQDNKFLENIFTFIPQGKSTYKLESLKYDWWLHRVTDRVWYSLSKKSLHRRKMLCILGFLQIRWKGVNKILVIKWSFLMQQVSLYFNIKMAGKWVSKNIIQLVYFNYY